MAWTDLHEGILEEFSERAPSVGITHSEFIASFSLIESNDDVNARNRACKADMVRRGLCVNCGKGSDRKNKALCSTCVAKQRDRWREKHPPKLDRSLSAPCVVCGSEVKRDAETCSKRCTQTRRYRALVAAGVCVRCKVNKPKSGGTDCTTCAPVTRVYKKKSNAASISVLNCQDKSDKLAR